MPVSVSLFGLTWTLGRFGYLFTLVRIIIVLFNDMYSITVYRPIRFGAFMCAKALEHMCKGYSRGSSLGWQEREARKRRAGTRDSIVFGGISRVER